MPSVDLETFLKKWSSEDNLDYRHDIREWMENSYINPFSFWEDLFAYNFKEADSTSQTVVFEKYDFYADCIVRNLGKNLLALKSINAAGEVISWTYDQIHTFVDAQVPHWVQNYNLEAGKTALLMLPYGIHFIVGLMTALHLGLTICVAPTKDRFVSQEQLQHALEEIKADIVVTLDKQKTSFYIDTIELDLSVEKPLSSLIGSHAYLANEIVQKHLSTTSGKENRVTRIEATRSYLIPLRDAVIALQLKPSICWARPFSSMYREEPSSTLMALLAGATIFDVSDELLLSNPSILKDEAIHILGVSYPLKQLWTRNPGCPTSKLKLWYRNPLFGSDHSWKAFSELNQLKKISTCQLIVDKEKGGITLFSQPKPLEILSFMHPSLGSPWKVLKIGENGDESTEGFGLFHVEPASGVEPYLIISQVNDAWSIIGTTRPLIEGYPYPIQMVEESVKTLDFVQACMILPERHPQHFINKQFTLLVFVSPKERHFVQQKSENWRHKIHHLVHNQVGEAFIPNAIIFYSIYPKIENNQLNRNWVESQYKRGSLFYKQNRSIYQSLNLLRQSIYENIQPKVTH